MFSHENLGYNSIVLNFVIDNHLLLMTRLALPEDILCIFCLVCIKAGKYMQWEYRYAKNQLFNLSKYRI